MVRVYPPVPGEFRIAVISGASAIDCWWDWRKALDFSVLLLALASLILVDLRSWISSFGQK